MMTSVSIVREKETGTMEILLVSPVRPMRIVTAKLVPYFVLSCIVLSTILLIAYGLLELPLSASAFNVVGVSLLYIILSLALGILISTMTRRQVVALLVSAMLFMLSRNHAVRYVVPRREHAPGIAMDILRRSCALVY